MVSVHTTTGTGVTILILVSILRTLIRSTFQACRIGYNTFLISIAPPVWIYRVNIAFELIGIAEEHGIAVWQITQRDLIQHSAAILRVCVGFDLQPIALDSTSRYQISICIFARIAQLDVLFIQ